MIPAAMLAVVMAAACSPVQEGMEGMEGCFQEVSDGFLFGCVCFFFFLGG